MIAATQVPEKYRTILDDQFKVYGEGRTVQVVKEIPDTADIPLQGGQHWLRIPDVICVAVDMSGSTQLSAATKDKTTAGAYQLFTGTAVRLFNEFDAPYIDVRGDGVFALFNGSQSYRALAAAITFKTFVEDVFGPTLKRDTGFEIGGHYGIDEKTVLVRRIGLKRSADRTDRQNEVWAGKPVNMACKLAAAAAPGELWVSDRFWAKVPDRHARLSCGCSAAGGPQGTLVSLWAERALGDDPNFDFEKAYVVKSKWCPTHGAEFCDTIMARDP